MCAALPGQWRTPAAHDKALGRQLPCCTRPWPTHAVQSGAAEPPEPRAPRHPAQSRRCQVQACCLHSDCMLSSAPKRYLSVSRTAQAAEASTPSQAIAGQSIRGDACALCSIRTRGLDGSIPAQTCWAWLGGTPGCTLTMGGPCQGPGPPTVFAYAPQVFRALSAGPAAGGVRAQPLGAP